MSWLKKTTITLVMLMLSLGAVAQDIQSNDELANQPLRMQVDLIDSDEQRVVIEDTEYFLEGTVQINGQNVAPSAVVNIMREGQKVTNLVADRDEEEGYMILREVDLF